MTHVTAGQWGFGAVNGSCPGLLNGLKAPPASKQYPVNA